MLRSRGGYWISRGSMASAFLALGRCVRFSPSAAKVLDPTREYNWSSAAQSLISEVAMGTRTRMFDAGWMANATVLSITTLMAGCGSSSDPKPNADNLDSVVLASARARQTPLDGATIPKYVDPLPTLASRRIRPTSTAQVNMVEFQQRILPASIYAPLPAPFSAGTGQWG